MSSLDNRINKLEARHGLKAGASGIVVTYPTDDPDRLTVNGQSMTRAELDEYVISHNLTILNVVYLPDNGRNAQKSTV